MNITPVKMSLSPVKFNSDPIKSSKDNTFQKTLELPRYNTPSFKGNEYLFDEEYRPNHIIKKMLDEYEFVFETPKGSELLHIKDAIKEFMVSQPTYFYVKDFYHSCSTYSTVDKIVNNGIDPHYILRTQHGPGFYFSGSEGYARQYGSAILEADLEGKICTLLPRWYSNIKTEHIIDKIIKFTGADYDSAVKVFDQYVRNLMHEELGIDFAMCDCEIVCFNFDKVSNMRRQSRYY